MDTAPGKTAATRAGKPGRAVRPGTGRGPQPAVDHRKGPRRRGDVLFQAIFDATLAELAECGYADLAMERVAVRARTSKTSLYSRWPSRAELVVAAIQHAAAEAPGVPDTGTLRGDLLALLRQMAARLAGPYGEAVRGLMTETLNDPARTEAARTALTGSRGQRIRELLARAAARGEIGPGPLSPWVTSAAPALLAHHFLTHGAPVPDEVLTGIVDDVALPLLLHATSRASVPGRTGSQDR